MPINPQKDARIKLAPGVILTLKCAGTLHEPTLWDARGMKHDPATEPLQLLEHAEYIYSVEGVHKGAFELEPSELFYPDDASLLKGRFRPRERVGRVRIELVSHQDVVGEYTVEVRSRKLDYVDHYRWMMRDIASYASEAIMNRFAASGQRFMLDPERHSEANYQRIEFLYALLRDESFIEALEQVTHRPHVTWQTRVERVQSRRRAEPRALARALTKPGPKLRSPSYMPVSHIPAVLEAATSVSTRDNTPNRFVQFALKSWLAMVLEAHDMLGREPDSGPVRRGLRVTQALEHILNIWLERPLFDDISPLTEFPGANQVLYKHAAYRKIWQVFLQTELASKLDWGEEHDRVAGVRNVAAIYEYWVFFCFLEMCERMSHACVRRAQLFKLNKSGMHVLLKEGNEVRFEGEYVASNRRHVTLKLFYNREFSSGGDGGSWSYKYRPDISLELVPEGESRGVFVHFDAKYKIDARSSQEYVYARHDDLNKMHVYHDAIMQSAGAFVVYPGTVSAMHRFEPEELLPGVGSYPMIPHQDSSDVAVGVRDLEAFLVKLIDHIASPATRHERARYWSSRAYDRSMRAYSTTLPWDKPPADAILLLGYVKSPEQLDWIRGHLLYNLRADPHRRGSVGFDSATLRADTILLYGEAVGEPVYYEVVSEAPRVFDAGMLLERGYPSPGGLTYFVHDIRQLSTPPLLDVPAEVLEHALASHTMPSGAPVSMPWATWLDALEVP